ncbi:MAG: hypothetical protein ACE5F1_03530, partial [Planctomycetota bacterium]
MHDSVFSTTPRGVIWGAEGPLSSSTVVQRWRPVSSSNAKSDQPSKPAPENTRPSATAGDGAVWRRSPEPDV